MAATSALIPSVASTFNVDEFFAGRIIWLYMLPYGLSALIYGPLARSTDCKEILLWAVGIFSLANLIAGLAPNLDTLFMARFLAGISGAAVVPLSLILISRNFSFRNRGKKVGYFFSFTFISSLLGLFLSGLVFWRWIFILPAIGAGLVWLGVCLYFPNISYSREEIRFNYFQTLSDRQILRLFIYIFSVSFLYHGIRQWLGVYFSKVYGLEQFLISMLLITVSLSGIFGESLGGILADRLGRIKVVNMGVILMLFALITLLFRNVLFSLFIIMFIWGLGWTFNHAGISTNLCDLPQRYLYESVSLNSSIRFLSGGLGAAFGGILADRSFNLEFIIFILCLGILLIFNKRFLAKSFF